VPLDISHDAVSAEAAFGIFVGAAEPRLRAAFVAHFGPEIGREATAEALAYGWAHWARVAEMDNPVGYLFRAGQSRVRPLLRDRQIVGPATSTAEPTDVAAPPWFEPKLAAALNALTAHQRAAVVLAHGFGYSHAEIAEVLGTRRSTVQNHVERAMRRLRDAMEVSDGD
jgi:RNA polymerase sigma factor (sigma-70 family)